MASLRSAALVLGVALTVVQAGCSSFATANLCHTDLRGTTYCPPAATTLLPPPPTRATLAVDSLRGNPRVLMFLAFSGGGSRAAVLSSETMIALKSFVDADLLSEVDVMSAVSGGVLPAAFYAATRDSALPLSDAGVAAALERALGSPSAPRALRLIRQPRPNGSVETRLECSAVLDEADRGWLLRLDERLVSHGLFDRITTLCRQAGLTKLRTWSDDDTRDRMSRDYIRRMLGNMLWPTTFLRYWFTAYDRSDIMAQTFADNLFDSPLLGTDHTFADLNPTRPFLVIHATDATDHPYDDEREHDKDNLEHEFGSAFTFTREDFQDRLHSDIGTLPVSQAAIASSAFPLVFPHVTLENFHTLKSKALCDPHDVLAPCNRRYVHLLDGGNADNLGLRSVKRMLLEMASSGRLVEDHDAVIVVLVDAFARPTGSSRRTFDPRSGIGRIVDFASLSEAVDVLLQRNRAQTLSEFQDPHKLLDIQRDCPGNGERQLPAALCLELARFWREDPPTGDAADEKRAPKDKARDFLRDRLVFYRVGLDTVAGDDRDLKRALDRIPTSFSINPDDASVIRRAVADRLGDRNACLARLGTIVRAVVPGTGEVSAARDACAGARFDGGQLQATADRAAPERRAAAPEQ